MRNKLPLLSGSVVFIFSPIASSLFSSRYVYGAKVWDARQEEVSMRRKMFETGCGTHRSRRCVREKTEY